MIVKDLLHFLPKLRTHLCPGIRLRCGFESTDSQHIRLDAEHIKQIAVEGDFSAESDECEGAGFRHQNAVAGCCKQILFVIRIIHTRPDRFAGRFDGSNRGTKFVQSSPADLQTADIQQYAVNGFVRCRLVETIKDGGE